MVARRLVNNKFSQFSFMPAWEGEHPLDTIDYVTGIGNAIKTFGTLLVMPPSIKIGQNNGKIKLKI